MAMRVRPKPLPEEAAPAWMVTYGDIMTLLLCFFVFLFSVAEVREDKLKAALGSLRAHLGLSPANASLFKVYTTSSFAKRMRPGAFQPGIPGEHFEVMTVAEGTKIVVGGRVLFEEGRATIRPQARSVLAKAGDLVRGHLNRIEIRGHCALDEVGEGSPFEDAEELSWRRAREVGRFLIGDAKIDPYRIRTTGCSYVEPAAPNLFPDEASRNRRVEIIVSEEYVKKRPTRDGGASE